MTNDTLSDILTRIRNALRMKSSMVEIPKTRITQALRKILLQEGFISELSEKSVVETKLPIEKTMLLRLKYLGYQRVPIITNLRRASRPGLRIYIGYKEVPQSLGRFGVTIVSTSKGLMTHHKSKNYQLGGEIVCYIWLLA